jgi:hypothetical protein
MNETFKFDLSENSLKSDKRKIIITTNSHKNLSEQSVLFLEYINNNVECFARSSYSDILEGHLFSFEDLNPWPLFISRETDLYFKNTATQVFNLIKYLPKRIFNNDFSKMSEYYGFSREALEVMFWGMPVNQCENFVSRGDFIIDANNDLKCIESNISSNLGGWEIDFLAKTYQKSNCIAKFLDANNIKLLETNLLNSLFQHIKTITEKLNNSSSQCILNIAIVHSSHSSSESEFSKLIKDKYKRYVYENKIEGEMFFCRHNDIEITYNIAFYKKKQIHCLLDLEESASFNLMRLAHENKIVILNGKISSVIGNKLNIALLSEYQESPVYTEREKEIIARHIPWTRRLVDGETRYYGEKISLKNFVINNQKKLVLKKAISLGGIDVLIGSKVSTETWGVKVKEIREVKNGEKWIVQEYVKPQEYWFQINADDVALYEVVFGLFVFGNIYAGGFLRLLPASDISGIINSKQGASESIMLVVE